MCKKNFTYDLGKHSLVVAIGRLVDVVGLLAGWDPVTVTVTVTHLDWHQTLDFVGDGG